VRTRVFISFVLTFASINRRSAEHRQNLIGNGQLVYSAKPRSLSGFGGNTLHL